MASRKDALLAELRAAGVRANGKGPIEKQPAVVLEGMVEKVRQDQAALAAGSGACPRHEGQVEGACPICRGIWAGEDVGGGSEEHEGEEDDDDEQ